MSQGSQQLALNLVTAEPSQGAQAQVHTSPPDSQSPRWLSSALGFHPSPPHLVLQFHQTPGPSWRASALLFPVPAPQTCSFSMAEFKGHMCSTASSLTHPPEIHGQLHQGGHLQATADRAHHPLCTLSQYAS